MLIPAADFFVGVVTFSSSNRYINKMEKFGSFYKDYQKTLFNYLMRMTGDYYLAGDIMQESFARLLERYNGEKRFADPTVPVREFDDFGGRNSIVSVASKT